MSDELLTDAEHGVIADLGHCAQQLAVIFRNGGGYSGDLDEAIACIHHLQHAVMAQAAARAYPELYRLAGCRDVPEGFPPGFGVGEVS